MSLIDEDTEKTYALWRQEGARAGHFDHPDGWRLAYEEFAAQFPLAEDVALSRCSLGGVGCEWITMPGADSGRVLLYLHGGCFVVGSMRVYRELVSRLARASGARAVGPDYRLAPEHVFPAALDDCVAAYRGLLDQGVAPDKIVIAGDSAGGGLTVSTLLALRAHGDPLPAAGVCLSPWVDLANTGHSLETKASIDPIMAPTMLEDMAKLYMGQRDRRAPLASPLYADLTGLPPLLVQVGTCETLLDDSLRLAERASAAGVEITLETYEHQSHVWHVFASIHAEARRAIERVGQFVRDRTSG